jgi:short-subunit dehydrogenase
VTAARSGAEARRTALVTGASGGIGLELARLFARGGHDLALVARSEGALRELAETLSREHGVRAIALPADLADPSTPPALAAALRERSLRVDVLVNNAGYGLNGPFAETNLARELAMIQVNVTAVTHLTKLFLTDMLAHRTGKILNVASTAAFVPGPGMAVYYATKAYVLSFSEALAEELRGTGVTVTALCPGPTRTGFQATAGAESANLFQGGGVMDQATVARAGYDALMKGKAVVVPGLRNRLQVESARLAPRSFVRRLVRRMNAPART